MVWEGGGLPFFSFGQERGGGDGGTVKKLCMMWGGGGYSKILPLKIISSAPRKRFSKSHVYKKNQFSFRHQKGTCYLQSLSPLNFSINHFLNLT